MQQQETSQEIPLAEIPEELPPEKLPLTELPKTNLQKPTKRKRFFGAKQYIGCCLDTNRLYSAHILSKRGSITIESLSTVELTAEASHYGKTKAAITSGLSSLKSLARYIDLLPMKKQELDAVIKYQIEPQLPYQLSQCVLDKILTRKLATSNTFLIFSAKKEDVSAHLEELKKVHIDPESVAPKAVGLVNFVRLFFPAIESAIVIDIGYTESICLYVHQDVHGICPIAIRSTSVGLSDSSDEEEDDSEKGHLKQLSRELCRILLHFRQSHAAVQELPIIFTGIAEQDPLILSLLGKLLGHPVLEMKDIPKGITFASSITPQDCLAYAIPIGLALSQSEYQKKPFSINLRQDELSYPQQWRRWRGYLYSYFALTILSALLLYAMQNQALRGKERALTEQYVSLAALHGKTPAQIEELFAKHTGSSAVLPKPEDGAAEAITSFLSTEQIQERLEFINQHLKKPPDEIPLHPNVPRVTDLIAWLTTQIESNEKDHPTITIESLSYRLVQHPGKGHLQDKYKAEVHMELTAPTPVQAKRFHDILTSPNDFVDPHDEIHWSSQKGRYQVSFVLKDKTKYQ